MTKSEAIHRAALRKHRHKRNYIATHEALLAEAEYLQQTGPDMSLWGNIKHTFGLALVAIVVWFSLEFSWQIIKGWFA